VEVVGDACPGHVVGYALFEDVIFADDALKIGDVHRLKAAMRALPSRG
jgi:hypothetical protein